MENFDELLSIILSIQSKDELKLFFKEILTDAEIEDIIKRWCLMKDLYNGISQRNIAKKYGISLCKITRGSKVLKNENSISKKLIKNFFKEKSNGNT